MKIIKQIEGIRQFRQLLGSVALVPTMGNLHEGHLDLVRQAKQEAEHVIVSIFVNPIQFGEGEDFDDYPRTLEADSKKLAELGVSAIFAPSVAELYPKQGMQSCRIVPSAIQNELCGASREGHFNGVATVVAKLFNIVQPTIACFGEKDYQQLCVIKEMVTELNMDIKIVAVPTHRDESGLALSSRNGYLMPDERVKALQLYQTLQIIQQQIESGATRQEWQALIDQGIDSLSTNGWQVDYLEIRDRETLLKPSDMSKNLIVLGAARLGKTRLIDNIKIND